MTDPVPVGVVGTGNMGSNHVRVYDELPEANLVEVVEPDPEASATIESAYDVRVLESVEDLQTAQAVTVSVPNADHAAVAMECIERGMDVLVEKPLAPSVSAAEAIVDAATAHDAVLQVGHIERFNPAIRTLAEVLDHEEIIALEAHRLGPFNEHLTSESVVFDLMIHDVDVVDSLVDADVDRLDAVGAVSHSDEIDHAIAQIKYDNGIVCSLTSSHVTHGKVRTLLATTRDAYIRVDYQDQAVTIQRRGREQTTTVQDRTGYRTETVTETPFVGTREPLKGELEHFLSCVRERTTPAVDGEDGVRAVRRAEEILDRIAG